MKKIGILLMGLAISAYAGCSSFGGNGWHTTNCYEKGVRHTWQSNNFGSVTTTNYNNSDGTRGTSNQFNFGNGNYQRTYQNNNGYRSTTSKIGNCYFFNDNQGNRRSRCY